MSPSRLFGFGFLALLVVGCTKHEKPNFIYMPDMVYSPAFKAQKEGANRTAPPGTVSRDYQSVGYVSDGLNSSYVYDDADKAGRALKNPLRRTREVLLRGKQVFNYTCITCHGPNGEGDGGVISHGYPRPPSLQSDKVRGWPDGSIFHVMTKGQNLMPSYASQVRPNDRWAVIHYIRALQRAKKPSAEDLQAYEQASQ